MKDEPLCTGDTYVVSKAVDSLISKPALSEMVSVWEAINRYVVACGGDPSSGVYGNTSRQVAVADVERAICSCNPALSDVERAAAMVATSWPKLGFSDAPGASSPPEWRRFVHELNCLRNELRKRGTL